MPWKESSVVDCRGRFVEEYLEGMKTMAELCREHGVSRKTGHKMVARFKSGGMAALAAGAVGR